MANSVDIGCGDNKDAIIGSYEAIKVNGTKLDTDVDNVSITQFVSIPNRGSCAIGLRFGTRYLVHQAVLKIKGPVFQMLLDITT